MEPLPSHPYPRATINLLLVEFIKSNIHPDHIPLLLNQEVNFDLADIMSDYQLRAMLGEQEAHSPINGLMGGNAELDEQLSQLLINGWNIQSPQQRGSGPDFDEMQGIVS